MNISHLTTNSQPVFTGQAPGMIVEDMNAKIIFNYITNELDEDLLRYLKSLSAPINLTTMFDSRKFSVLTYAAYRDDTNCFKILFEYASRFISQKLFTNITM